MFQMRRFSSSAQRNTSAFDSAGFMSRQLFLLQLWKQRAGYSWCAAASRFLTISPAGWNIALIGNVVALGGVLLGMVALAAGRGPRTASNDFYHRTNAGIDLRQSAHSVFRKISVATELR
jgi:hypothetical protein